MPSLSAINDGSGYVNRWRAGQVVTGHRGPRQSRFAAREEGQRQRAKQYPEVFGPRVGPPAPVAPASSSLADYEAEYRRSLEQARGGLTRQFQLALSDIANRERAAGQAVGMLPGQINELYAQGASGLANAVAALDQAQAAAGLQSFMSAGAQMAPLQAAIGADQSARLADVPLLRLAMATEFARQRAGVQNARLEAEQGLLADERDFARQRLLTADERRYQDRVRGEDRAFQLSLRDLERQERAQAEPDPNGSGLPRAEADAIRNSAAYKYAMQLRNQGVWEPRSFGRGAVRRKLSAEEILARYEGNPRLYRVLAADLLGGPAMVARLMGGGA